MYYKSYLVILLLALSGCVTSSKNTVTEFKPVLTEDKKALRNMFVGKWISEQPNDKGGKNIATIERMSDSRYINEFKVFDAASELKNEQKEFGFWGVSGGIYFTMFRGWIKGDSLSSSDPTDAYNYDAYQIIKTSPNKLIYKSLASGNQYTYDRVE